METVLRHKGPSHWLFSWKFTVSKFLAFNFIHVIKICETTVFVEAKIRWSNHSPRVRTVSIWACQSRVGLLTVCLEPTENKTKWAKISISQINLMRGLGCIRVAQYHILFLIAVNWKDEWVLKVNNFCQKKSGNFALATPVYKLVLCVSSFFLLV